MTNVCTRNLLIVLFTSFILNNAYAETIEQLINNGELKLSSKIIKDDKHIVGQPFTIVIEVATNRWFARGTSIEAFSLANTVIIPNETAINGNKRIDGVTWSTQTREIVIYPSKAGLLNLPEIEVNISVNHEQFGVVDGSASINKQVIMIALPNALKNIEHYIVSPKVTLDIDVSSDNKTPYEIGDAVSQTITLIAEDTPGMMLPPVVFPQIEGLSIYHRPSQVFDKNNRGSLIGTRIESYTFIFEQPGNYQLEQQTIYWWDTSRKQLTELIIPNRKWTVSGEPLTQTNYSKGLVALFNKSSLYLATSLLIALWVINTLYRYRLPIKQSYQQLSHQQKRHAAKAFIKAIKEQNYSLASQNLYNYCFIINHKQGLHLETLTGSIQARKLIQRLHTLAFDRENANTLTPLTVSDAKKLLQLLCCKKSIKADKIALKININR